MGMIFNLVIQPQRVQLISEQQTPSFPWYEGCVIRITATGMIGSGVVCTGLTPPGGWGEWPVREEEREWPCRGGAARRYALIGSIDGENWFYVGRDKSMLASGVSSDPRQQIFLRLAVNRPLLEQVAAGDHQWDVQIETFEPDEIPCEIMQTRLTDGRMIALNNCERIAGANRALVARRDLMSTAFMVSGALAIALITVALPILLPQQLAQQAAQTAAVTAVQNTLREFLRGVSPIGSLLSGVITPLITISSVRSATTAVQANASPVGLNPFIRIVIVALTLAMIAAFGVAIGLALSLLTLGADRDNAHSDWDSSLERISSDLVIARRVCGSMIDGALPSCAALEG
jgi:hypothetical protein